MTMTNARYTIGTSAVQILTAETINRRVYLHTDSSQPVWVGGSGVTAANGLEIHKSELVEMYVPAGETFWAVSDLASQEISILYQSD
jgi:hypothetical protein